MKAYGIPRNPDAGAPDCTDIQEYGFKSSISRVPKHGVIKNSFRKVVKTAAARRFWKKKARRQGQTLCDSGLADSEDI